jgi:hypothetical protein
MYKDDFILRHIRLFVQAIAKVLGLIKEGDLGLALETVQVTFRDFLGMAMDDFVSYPDDRMKEFLYFGELTVMGLNKAGLASSMLIHAGLIYRAKGDEEKAVAFIGKAIRLLLEIILSEEENPQMPDFAPTIEDALKEVSLDQLDSDTLIPLSFYFDRQKAFGNAHDAMQIMLARDVRNPDTRDLAKSFYVYLKDESDDVLSAGGINREAIDKALEELK